MLESELPYWLVLYRYPAIGPMHFRCILENFGQLSCLFNGLQPCAELVQYLQEAGVKRLTLDWAGVEKDLAFASRPDSAIIDYLSPDYPLLLKETSGAPPLLFIQGNIQALSTPQIAMVGSRNPTPMGIDLAFQFAKELVSHRLSITSGLALGIDGASHRGALAAQGVTLGIIGSGLDVIYPASHKNLAQEIRDNQGAMVSEFPMGTLPKREHFPRRNRLISGMSMGVLVVEAALNSGSLITARYATEQGREVFAVPSSPHNLVAKGCHQLIREGAKLVEAVSHILEELQPLSTYVSFSEQKMVSKNTATKNKSTNKSIGQLALDLPIDSQEESAEGNRLLTQIGFECTSVDTIILRAGCKADIATSLLLELELSGKVVSVPGGYVRVA